MVDRKLGIPEGSTGSYYRTRQALLEAAVKRVRELDFAEIEEARSSDTKHGDVAETITALVVSANDPRHHSRFLARNVLFMEAANNEELSRLMHSTGHGYFHAAEEMLRSRGVSEPELPARALACFMAGLILGQVIYPEPSLTPEQVLQAVERFLDSF